MDIELDVIGNDLHIRTLDEYIYQINFTHAVDDAIASTEHHMCEANAVDILAIGEALRLQAARIQTWFDAWEAKDFAK